MDICCLVPRPPPLSRISCQVGLADIALNKNKLYTEEPNSTPQHLCVAEDILLLNGGVLYGFTGLDILYRGNNFLLAYL